MSPSDRESLRQRLCAGVAELGLALDESAIERLLDYVELLARWNQAYNLTAVRDPDEMLTKHVLDSLTVLPFLHGPRVLDVGTGAGLPGIPLALVRPEVQFTLLDSNGKKTRFVTHAVATLALKNVEVLQARAEDYHPAVPFATVLSRAFASIGDFVRLAGHACAVDGRLLAMKGARPDAELKELPAGFRVKAVHPLKVPGLDAERCLVEIEKTAV